MEKRQKTQYEPAFTGEGRGEASRAPEEGIESTAVGLSTESQANTNKLIEEACEKENLKEALRRVKANAGAAGVDGMTVKELSTEAGTPQVGPISPLLSNLPLDD